MIYAALPLSGDYGTLEVLAFHGDDQPCHADVLLTIANGSAIATG